MTCIEKWRKRKQEEFQAEEQLRRLEDIEAALVELADMASAQDDAIVEIAELIGE